jgi:hypothetical protein
MSPKVRTGVLAGATLAVFVLALAVFVLPFAFPTPPPIVTRFQSTRVFSPNAKANGVRDVATISVRLRQPSRISLTVRSLESGEGVARIVDARYGRGWHNFRWNGHGAGGRPVPDGSYAIDLHARSGRKQWNSSRRVVVDTTPPRLRSLVVRSAALTGRPGPECRLELRSADAAALTLEAVRGEVVARRVGPRPVTDGQTVHWGWNGLRAGGRPVATGLWRLRAVVADPSGNRLSQERSCWVGHMVGRSVPAVVRPGGRVHVRLRTDPNGAALAPGAPIHLALYRRVATPGRDLADPLGRRVAVAASGPAGHVALRLPRTVRPSALWLVARSHGRRALIVLRSP